MSCLPAPPSRRRWALAVVVVLQRSRGCTGVDGDTLLLYRNVSASFTCWCICRGSVSIAGTTACKRSKCNKDDWCRSGGPLEFQAPQNSCCCCKRLILYAMSMFREWFQRTSNLEPSDCLVNFVELTFQHSRRIQLRSYLIVRWHAMLTKSQIVRKFSMHFLLTRSSDFTVVSCYWSLTTLHCEKFDTTEMECNFDVLLFIKTERRAHLGGNCQFIGSKLSELTHCWFHETFRWKWWMR